jgi:hypothetical protein
MPPPPVCMPPCGLCHWLSSEPWPVQPCELSLPAEEESVEESVDESVEEPAEEPVEVEDDEDELWLLGS